LQTLPASDGSWSWKSTASITRFNEKQTRAERISWSRRDGVIRFSASDAVQNPEGVWAEIARVLGVDS
jgi:hypothetical protein